MLSKILHPLQLAFPYLIPKLISSSRYIFVNSGGGLNPLLVLCSRQRPQILIIDCTNPSLVLQDIVSSIPKSNVFPSRRSVSSFPSVVRIEAAYLNLAL